MTLATFVLQCTNFVHGLFAWSTPFTGDAGQWLGEAKAQGFLTQPTPAIGSIAVWAPKQGGAGDVGHVAAVVGLQGNGLPIVQESNWPEGTNGPTTRNVNAASAAGIQGYVMPFKAQAGGAPPLDWSSPGSLIAGVQPGDVVGAITNLPATVADAVGTAAATGIGSVFTVMGHGIANLITTIGADLVVLATRFVVPLAVAAVVVWVLMH